MNLLTATPVYKVVLDAISRMSDGTSYVVRGCAPTAFGTGSLRVDVAAGNVVGSGTGRVFAGGNVIPVAADGSNPRRDIVYITAAGALATTAGTAAASPVPPALPAGAVLIAIAAIPAAAADYTAGAPTAYVEDARQSRVGELPAINAYVFGATGDGATDDTAAIQAAIAALPAGGGIVSLGLGAFKVTGITLPKGVRLIGAGKHQTTIFGATNTGLSVISTVSGGGGGQEIAHLQVQPTGATNIGINVKGTDTVSIHDCRFYSACATMIQLDHNNVAGAYNHRIDQNEIDCTVTAASVGIKLTNTQGAPTSGITSCVITRNHFVSDAAVVYVNFTPTHGANVYEGNLFSPRTSAVGVGIDLSANAHGDMITNNYFDHLASGIKLASGSGVASQHAVIANHNDGCTAYVTNGNAAVNGLMVIDHDTTPSVSFGQYPQTSGQFVARGDSSAIRLGLSLIDTRASGIQFSLLNGVSAVAEVAIRNENAGTHPFRVTAAGDVIGLRGVYPSNVNELFGQAGVPGAGLGANGDFYFRSDGGAGTSIYMKRAGAWVAIV